MSGPWLRAVLAHQASTNYDATTLGFGALAIPTLLGCGFGAAIGWVNEPVTAVITGAIGGVTFASLFVLAVVRFCRRPVRLRLTGIPV